MDWNKNKCKAAAIIAAMGITLGVPSVSLLASEVSGGAEASQELQSAMTKKDDADQLYGIGSVSKIITAAAVMKLCDMGLMELDDYVTEYLPEFTMADERYQQITVRMLLNHSSGLYGMTDFNGQLIADNSTYAHDHLLSNLSSQVLKHTPGERSIYCNDGFTLAELIIEQVSGMSYTEFVEENLCKPLGITDLVSPQSDFDRNRLAPIRAGSLTVKEETLNLIGSGGMYATAKDLSLFTRIFMEDCDILSEDSKEAMMQIEHMGAFLEEGTDADFVYGLGFDSVNTYPFGSLGIKALSKGGSTQFYHSNVIILPEHNLSAAVVSSGNGSFEGMIAQEIIMAVLAEEGLVEETEITLPVFDNAACKIEESQLAYEGLYGGMSLYEVAFEGEEMLITTVGTKNDRTFRFTHTGDGEFISQDGDYVGMGSLMAAAGGNIGITKLHFVENELGEQYIYADSYMHAAGLGQSAVSLPFAMKLSPEQPDKGAVAKWKEREEKKYLLVNEAYSAAAYLLNPMMKIQVDEQGYIQAGVYQQGGFGFNPVKIESGEKAGIFQAVPVMVGRDGTNISAEIINGIEYLSVNQYRFIDAENLPSISEIANVVQIPENGEAVWFQIPAGSISEEQWKIECPERGSYFIYDKDFTCLASSLERTAPVQVTIPDDGYIMFVGEAMAEFGVN